MEHANANITHTTEILAARMIEGATLLGEYAKKLIEARASTEGKGINLTKYTYAVGVECLNDVEAFKTYLIETGVKLKGGYKPEKHFFAVIKAFAAVNKTPIAAGEISRIGMICQDSYSNDIVVTDLEAYIAQLGGLIATYKHGVMLRQDRKTANDNTIIDALLHLRVFDSAGFLGILNLTAKEVALLVKSKGLKTTGDGGDDPASGGVVGTEIIVGGVSTTFTDELSIPSNNNGFISQEVVNG
jgi:hypothetical protein